MFVSETTPITSDVPFGAKNQDAPPVPEIDRTVTFLLTDIEGSTGWWRRNPDAMRRGLARHDSLLTDAIRHHNGDCFKHTGDGVLAAFANAHDAVNAALDAQTALHEAFADDAKRDDAGPDAEELPIRVRIALHTGDALYEPKSGDYFGLSLSRGARLLETLHGGQVCLSRSVEGLVRDRLPHGALLRDLGEHRLRDLESRERIFRLVHAALPDTGDALRTLDTVPNNLPAQRTSFVGRDREIGDLETLLRPGNVGGSRGAHDNGHNRRRDDSNRGVYRSAAQETRLLTLTGAGGSGKTRLSLQAAAQVLPHFPDGVVFIELAALTEDATVASTVLNAVLATLGISQSAPQAASGKTSGGAAQDALVAHLCPLRLLLVLDNCEHLIEACAALADVLLRACPHLVLLATSRIPLNVGGESLIPVAPLALPDAATLAPRRLEQFAAVRLFVERARQVVPDFALAKENGAHVATICRRLDGLPLALELAAAWVAVLSLAELATQLDDRFDLLTGGDRSALPRHQTLRAMVEWSYRLLSKSEQRLFRGLAVFAGGWTLEATQQVCADKSLKSADVLSNLRGLLEKSLVVREATVASAPTRAADKQPAPARYRMLETMREYARKLLEKDAQRAALRERHGTYFLSLAERDNNDALSDEQQNALYDLLEREQENVRLAYGTGDATRRLRLCVGLHRFWIRRGHLAHGREMLNDALSFTAMGDSVEPLLCARASNAAGVLALSAGDTETARVRWEEAATLFANVGDEIGLANASANLGLTLLRDGNYSAARARLDSSRRIYDESADMHRAATMYLNLGAIALHIGDHEEARRLLQHTLYLQKQQGNLTNVAGTLHNLAHVEHLCGELRQEENYLRESLEFSSQRQDRLTSLRSVRSLAHCAFLRKDYERSVVLFASAEVACFDLQCKPEEENVVHAREALMVLQEQLGVVSFAQLWNAGSGLAWDDVVLLALNEHSANDTNYSNEEGAGNDQK